MTERDDDQERDDDMPTQEIRRQLLALDRRAKQCLDEQRYEYFAVIKCQAAPLFKRLEEAT